VGNRKAFKGTGGIGVVDVFCDSREREGHGYFCSKNGKDDSQDTVRMSSVEIPGQCPPARCASAGDARAGGGEGGGGQYFSRHIFTWHGMKDLMISREHIHHGERSFFPGSGGSTIALFTSRRKASSILMIQ
jgi:hypothetical protein